MQGSKEKKNREGEIRGREREAEKTEGKREKTVGPRQRQDKSMYESSANGVD